MKTLFKSKRMLAISAMLVLAIVFLGVHYYNNQYYARRVVTAIEQEDIDALAELLDSPFGNLNCKPTLWIVEVMGEYTEYTPLQAACRLGNPKIVKMLLDNGADVNYTHWDATRGGGSPLIKAAGSLSEDRLQVIRLLVEAGADLSYETVAGDDALSCAVYAAFERDDTIEIIEYLEQQGMDIHKKYSGTENTLLHKACERGNFVVVQYLVEKRGFDVNAVNADGNTPLVYFLRFSSDRNQDVLLFLLQSGADPNLTNKEGKNAYDYVAEKHPELLELLGR